VDGFEVPRTIYRLEWDDEAYDGLVVRVRALNIAEAIVGVDLSWTADDTLDSAQRIQKLDELHSMFIAHVVDWNLMEAGQPVPVTLEGLRSMEGAFVGSMVRAWLNNSIGVSRPLDGGSTSGDLSAVESIPMEPLSESLAS
jgi:hypothetical protein